MNGAALLALARYTIAVLLAVSLPPAMLYWFIVHPSLP